MRPRDIQVAAVIACAVLVHALWGPTDRAHQTPGGKKVSPTLGEPMEEVLRSVRSIRIGSDSPPWVVMHALLAFGPDLEIVDVRRDQPVRILDGICGPGAARFFQVMPGSSRGNRGTPDGIQSRSECHPDQWLCILSAHAVPLTRRIVLDGEYFTLRDRLEASKGQSASGCSETAAWTIPALCCYLPRKARWQNELGEEVTMTSVATDFLRREDWRTGPCNGTHHLYALASLKVARILRGETATRLDRTLEEALRLLQRNQNADGTWMCNWQTEKDKPQDVFDTVHITGHHLEWIALAATEEQVNAKWLLDAVRGLIGAIRGIDAAEVEKAIKARPEAYGSLCHAARGLHLIKKRWSCEP